MLIADCGLLGHRRYGGNVSNKYVFPGSSGICLEDPVPG